MKSLCSTLGISNKYISFPPEEMLQLTDHSGHPIKEVIWLLKIVDCNSHKYIYIAWFCKRALKILGLENLLQDLQQSLSILHVHGSRQHGYKNVALALQT